MGTIVASENEFPQVLFAEGAAPSTPASGLIVAYAKAGGVFAWKDDAGDEHIVGEGGGIPATVVDAAGDLIVGTAADTVGRLAIGATNGMSLRRVSGALGWAFPPGHVFDRVARTTNVTGITGTTEGTASTILTSNATTFDGSTEIDVEVYLPSIVLGTTYLIVFVLDGATVLGQIALPFSRCPVHAVITTTPSAASHTYTVKAYVDAGTGQVLAGAGGTGAYVPAFIRLKKT